jgi:hypothetical protein
MPSLPVPPENDVRLTPRLLLAGSVFTLVVFAAALLWFRQPIAVDGWSYYELSNTVFADFYRANTQRQMELHTEYSTAFPPLWPILIAISRAVSDWGIYNVYVLNLLFSLAILFSLVRLFKQIDCAPNWAVVSYLFLFSLYYYTDNCWEGLSAPVTVWLFIEGVGQVLLSDRRDFAVLKAGVFFGLACLSRFDMAFATLFAGLFAGFYAARHNGWIVGARRFLIYSTAVVLVLAPWIAYCWKHFGSLFASDNSRQAYSAIRCHVMEYFPTPLENDLRTRPLFWLKGLLTTKLSYAMSSGIKAVVLSPLPLFAILALAAWWFRPKDALSRLSTRAKAYICLASLLTIAMPIPVVMAGYAHPRYWIIPVLVVFTLLLITLQCNRPAARNRREILLAIALLAVSATLNVVVHPILRPRSNWMPREAYLVPLRPSESMEQLAQAVRQDAKGQPHQMLYMPRKNGGNGPAAMYGALTGDTISISPLNVGDVFVPFLEDWKVTHVYDVDEALATVDKSGIELKLTSFPGLYRVQRTLETPSPGPEEEKSKSDRKLSPKASVSPAASDNN